MQVEISVLTPVLRLAILILADAFQVTDVDSANFLFDTPLDDVLR